MKSVTALLMSSFFLCASTNAAPSINGLSSCQLVFGINNTQGQILGIEPIAGNALQADLTVSSYLRHVLQFQKTTVNYFDSGTSRVHEVTMPKSPNNACHDTGSIRVGAELLLRAISFVGFGAGDKDLGCFIGHVSKDIISGASRPMVICSNQYSSALFRPDFQEHVCSRVMLNIYGLDQASCVKNMETAAYQLLQIKALVPPTTNSTL